MAEFASSAASKQRQTMPKRTAPKAKPFDYAGVNKKGGDVLMTGGGRIKNW